jgi:hypothetical protein
MRRTALLAVLAVLLWPQAAEVHAQDGYMIGRPTAQLTVRAGPVQHRVGGDVFEFFRSELTLDRGDFRTPMVAGELNFAIHPRFDVLLGGAWSKVESRSEFRDWVDEDDLPIEQSTSFRVTPLTASARFYLTPRGRSISDLAYVPARTTPYVGAGGGIAWYRLEQEGDFVSDDLTIFRAQFRSSGSTAVGHAFAGVDHWFTPRVGLNVEGRYTMGSASPSDDFSTWDSIDLSGAQLGVGLTVRW